MSVVLLLLGVVVAGAGLAALGFAIPFNELPISPTLALAGTTAICSGLILIGLAAVVGELRRLADAMRGRPIPRGAQPVDLAAAASPTPATVASIRPPPAASAPRPRGEPPAREPRAAEAPAAPTVDVSTAAIERLRSSIPRADRPKVEPSVVAESEEVPLSPNGNQPAPPRAAELPPEPRVAPADRPAAATVEAVKPSRLDFLFRSRQARPLKPQNFTSTWPAGSRAARPEPRAPEPRLEERPAAASVPADAPPVDAEPRRAEPAILKSGVVDGMAYTLYADGSIEAKLPSGTVRFGSIAELRAHIESNG